MTETTISVDYLLAWFLNWPGTAWSTFIV